MLRGGAVRAAVAAPGRSQQRLATVCGPKLCPAPGCVGERDEVAQAVGAAASAVANSPASGSVGGPLGRKSGRSPPKRCGQGCIEGVGNFLSQRSEAGWSPAAAFPVSGSFVRLYLLSQVVVDICIETSLKCGTSNDLSPKVGSSRALQLSFVGLLVERGTMLAAFIA